MGNNKYHAQKTNGYASKKEARRAAELKLMERAGQISNLEEQVRFKLIPAQYATVAGKPKCLERAVDYVADFVYTDAAGRQVVEDTKGFRTPDYIIKRKLMLWRFGIQITEV